MSVAVDSRVGTFKSDIRDLAQFSFIAHLGADLGGVYSGACESCHFGVFRYAVGHVDRSFGVAWNAV